MVLSLDPALIHHPDAMPAHVEPVRDTRIDMRDGDSHRSVIFVDRLLPIQRREAVTIISRIEPSIGQFKIPVGASRRSYFKDQRLIRQNLPVTELQLPSERLGLPVARPTRHTPHPL